MVSSKKTKVKVTRLENGESSGECCHIIVDKWYEVESAGDVFIDILLRLPVKSLLVCKSVCKRWRRLISSQAFVKLQLIQSRKDPIYIVYPSKAIDMDLYFMKDSDEIMQIIRFPNCFNGSEPSIISSVDGLICCVNYPLMLESGKTIKDLNDLEVRICNPMTRDVQLLPKATVSEEPPSIGVAFCPQINEYKVFRFFSAKRKRSAKRRCQVNRRLCEVYSSCTGSWSAIGRVSRFPMFSDHDPLGCNHVFVNGKVYWFVASEEDSQIPGSILAVDLEGKFETIELPDEVNAHSYLVSLEGCLSLVIVYDDVGAMVVWSLECCKDGKWDWKWKCNDDVPFSGTVDCVEFVTARNCELFFITTNYYFIYDLEQKVWEDILLLLKRIGLLHCLLQKAFCHLKGARTADISSGSST